MLNRVRQGALGLARNALRQRNMATIVYTNTDEAPMLATRSFLPVASAFSKSSGLDYKYSDISLAGRILAQFPERLSSEQRVPDELTALGELCKTPDANVIKLPNISASGPQLCDAIAELQSQGYDIPAYPTNPSTSEEKAAHAAYAKVLGSAVNPVLREGNSDRRVAAPVKAYAQANPKILGDWAADNRTHVAHMEAGDFYGSEQSAKVAEATSVRIELETSEGVTVLKPEVPLQALETIDISFMSAKQLQAYFAKEILAAKEQGIMLSLHLKATMMKVSDPIIFGHCVKVFFKTAFEKHAALFAELGVDANNGIEDVYSKITGHAQEADVLASLEQCYKQGPGLAMVDSRKGITNLHVPNDVIIDASVPPVIRDSGCMWNRDDALEDTKMLIPDRNYATMYGAIVEDCQHNGKFDVSTMGNVSNVGLMAQKAEEYGSHDKTFEIPADGRVVVRDNNTGDIILEHKQVEKGDIWRMCQTKRAPVVDWVKLAVSRARITGNPAVFWLDSNRAHDRNLISDVQTLLQDHDISGLDIHIMAPADAMKWTLARVRNGQDTISVTGNVLRDYLTDLFPILELGTSAKMLSIVPLLAGGGLYETGAGGSAPKHIQQLQAEGHLRWDSLGEFLALAVSMEDLSTKTGDKKIQILGSTLNDGISQLLNNNKSPLRKVGQLDNRGSHYYVARYWADALAEQKDDGDLAREFAPVRDQLVAGEEAILTEIDATQGSPHDLGGYFRPDPVKMDAVMRPSATFNAIIDNM